MEDTSHIIRMKNFTPLIMGIVIVVLIFAGIAPLAASGYTDEEENGTQQPPPPDRQPPDDGLTLEEALAYREVILKTENMVNDQAVWDAASVWGLDVLNVTWEDTGRYSDSAVGPNISDMTIQMQWENPADGSKELHLMPVIRFPNFSDVTGDISPGQFSMKAGNQNGTDLRDINLKQFLRGPGDYLTAPESWAGGAKSLYAANRDSHVLVSAQACFLPIPEDGIATFNPVLFNYQSVQDDPAVLTVLVTREGTSTTVIDNVRDSFEAGWSWGQRLFFNANGEKASLTGRRMSDHLEDVAEAAESTDPSDPRTAEAAAEDTEGLNMVLLIQIPLKQKRPPMRNFLFDGAMMSESESAPMAAMEDSDVEEAVIGHGELEGPFVEIDGLKIKRDTRFPVRVTVQFYKATSNGVVSNADMAEIARQIATVYSQADYVGSLVTGDRSNRPTDWEGDHTEPPGWWDDFWARHWMNTGMTAAETMRMLRELRGQNWVAPRDLMLMEAAMQDI